MEKERKLYFDNIKILMIFLAIFGNAMEMWNGAPKFFMFIYSFHMPVMMFITGYFARFNKRAAISNVFTYAVFQTLGTLTRYFCFGNDYSFINVLTNQRWTLWYFYVYTIYIFLVPLLNLIKNKKILIAIWATAIVVSLFTPYSNILGGFKYQLGRLFSFFPYFLGGYIVKRIDWKPLSKNTSICIKIVNCALIVASITYIVFLSNFNLQALWGSYPYAETGANPLSKLAIIASAFNYILFFTYTIRINKQLFILTNLGRNTLFMYLFHPIVLTIVLEYTNGLRFAPWANTLICFAITIAIIITFGNKWVNKGLVTVFGFKWIETKKYSETNSSSN